MSSLSLSSLVPRLAIFLVCTFLIHSVTAIRVEKLNRPKPVTGKVPIEILHAPIPISTQLIPDAPAPAAATIPTPAPLPTTTQLKGSIAPLAASLLKEDHTCLMAVKAIAKSDVWKGVRAEYKKKFLDEHCQDITSRSCQTYSDVFLLSPQSNGTTTSKYIRQAFQAMNCTTWPSFHLKQDYNAGCHLGAQVLKHDVKSDREARRYCLEQVQPKCVSYTWSNVSRSHLDTEGRKVLLPANTLAMCSRKLHGHVPQPGTQIGHRQRSYLVRPDTSTRCDEEQGTIIANVMSGSEARQLCDRARLPACKGYVWTGPVGIGRNASAEPTPNTVMLCAGFREYHPTELKNSKYETAAVIQDYMIHSNKKGACSKWSEIGVRWDVMSSMEARLECDLFDGINGPKCLSYVWNKGEGSVTLCASVPQTSHLPDGEHFETGWLRPNECQEMSNRWSVTANSSWGFAPDDVKILFTAMECQTAPSSCEQLSNFYGLSPHVDLALMKRVPGSIRDLWLQQKCSTEPTPEGRDRQKPAYQRLTANMETIEARLKEMEDVIQRAELSRSTKNKVNLRWEVQNVRQRLDNDLKTLKPVV